MNIVLWILQIVLAIAFLASGAIKLTRSKDQLAKQNMGWVDDVDSNVIKLAAAAEVLGALGLVLPSWTGIAPVLTPIAAVGLMVVMAGAMFVHARRKETMMVVVNLVLFLLLAVVAWGRFGPYAF